MKSLLKQFGLKRFFKPKAPAHLKRLTHISAPFVYERKEK